MLSNMATNIRTASGNGSMSPELAQQLLMAILEVWQAIANNTAPVGQIYQTLSTLNTAGGSRSSKIQEKKSTQQQQNTTIASDVNSTFKNVVSQLAAIAKG